jgi:hypothetical protein
LLILGIECRTYEIESAMRPNMLTGDQAVFWHTVKVLLDREMGKR